MSNSGNPLQATPQFDVALERHGNVAIVRVIGEVDIATAPKLTSCLREAGEASTSLVVADLSAVTLLDSTGLGALIDAQQDAGGADLRLVVSEAHVLKIFSVTGLDQVFAIFPSLDEALAPAS